MAGDRNAAVDQADIATDIPYIQSNTTGSFAWRWYQNGYDTEPNEPTPDGVNLTSTTIGYGHLNYVSHHNGAQYFGYLSNNVQEQTNMKGENDFFTDIAQQQPAVRRRRVLYPRRLLQHQGPDAADPERELSRYVRPDCDAELAAINLSKSGDDDHPSYSDKQLSEAMNARVINAIASNPKMLEPRARSSSPTTSPTASTITCRRRSCRTVPTACRWRAASASRCC